MTQRGGSKLNSSSPLGDAKQCSTVRLMPRLTEGFDDGIVMPGRSCRASSELSEGVEDVDGRDKPA
jgi:hypothetical protein